MNVFLSIMLLALSTGVSANEALPAGHPPIGKAPHALPPSNQALSQTATVLDIIQVPQYTYLEISQNKQSRWLAAPTVEVKKSASINFDEGMEMTDFYSKTLKRSFPKITFVNKVIVNP